MTHFRVESVIFYTANLDSEMVRRRWETVNLDPEMCPRHLETASRRTQQNI